MTVCEKLENKLKEKGLEVTVVPLALFYKIYAKSRKSSYLIIDEFSTDFVKMEKEAHGEYSILLHRRY